MNKRIILSVVISCFNEERNIESCLKSVKGFADEIIVVDNNSTDKTNEISKKYTNKIFTQKNDPLKIDLQKNYGFEKAMGDWILSLDADERVTPELQKEITQTLSSNHSFDGYYIPRKNIIFGKWIQHSIWYPDYQLRLFKKGKGKFVDKAVHKSLVVEGQTEKLKEPLIHNNYESVSQFIYKMDAIYTENEARQIISSGKKLDALDVVRMPVHDFLKTFFLQQGYKDGLHGLVLSLFQAFYSVIVFAKVWEKQGFSEENPPDFLTNVWNEILKLSKEFQYWFLTESIKDTRNIVKKTYLKILRRKTVRKI